MNNVIWRKVAEIFQFDFCKSETGPNQIWQHRYWANIHSFCMFVLDSDIHVCLIRECMSCPFPWTCKIPWLALPFIKLAAQKSTRTFSPDVFRPPLPFFVTCMVGVLIQSSSNARNFQVGGSQWNRVNLYCLSKLFWEATI